MVKILADSTCDLSPELIQKYHIEIIPLYIRLGEKEYRDGIDIKPPELYKWSDEHGETPKTAAPGIEDIENHLKKMEAEGTDENEKDSDGSGGNGFDGSGSESTDSVNPDEYVIFTISSSMSASFNNCRLAAEDMEINDRVFIIDSENLSTGIGLQILRAVDMAAAGKTGAEIATEMEQIRGKVRASFVVDTLTYLHRGGRCSGLAALLGSALRLHPRIAVVNGAMRPEKKYRGKDVRYVMDYVRDMEKDLLNACNDRVFITHSGCSREIVDSVRAYLESLNHFDEILETRAGSVISSHCGPGTLGVLFIAD
ncbi:MAG: DegV family protein [Lachnospiraceae bacterium]|nr:DegV family protein [Lachnospiraceae bacterium]